RAPPHAAAATERLPRPPTAWPQVVAVFGDDVGGAHRSKDRIERKIRLLRQRLKLVLVAQTEAEAQLLPRLAGVPHKSGPLLGVELHGLLAEALGEAAA